ncbi:hypothetical protein GCM10017710_26790 [Arthrobacter ramosus]
MNRLTRWGERGARLPLPAVSPTATERWTVSPRGLTRSRCGFPPTGDFGGAGPYYLWEDEFA